MYTDVIIIGAGPAGLFAAKTFKDTKIKVKVFEATNKLSQKLLISGAGQCNFTNNINIKEFFERYGVQGKFLKRAFHFLDNKQTVEYFKFKGLDSFINENDKVFPHTLKSQDLLDVILRDCKGDNISIELNSKVDRIEKVGEMFNVYVGSKKYESSNVVLAIGGKSYQHTGSAGDIEGFAKSIGCKIKELKPALTPVYVNDYCFTDLSGIALRDITISQYRDNKKQRDIIGDLLFTHKNLSGPIILNNSRYFIKDDELRINMVGYSYEAFNKYIMKLVNENGKLNLRTILQKNLVLPKRLIELVLEVVGVDGSINCGDLKKDQRAKLVKSFVEFKVIIKKLEGFKIAMVTSGGVDLSRVNKNTMESKDVKNLYFAGEVLDIDGDTGGFNIQAAFSTGNLAGMSILKKLGGE